MRDINAIIPAKDKWCSIVWQVNDVCNFKCSYCSEWNWGGRHKNDQEKPVLSALNDIIDHYQSEGYRYFKLFLSGGEPTVWKLLNPVVETFRERVEWPGSCVGINTNLSRPLKWWEKNYHLFEDVVASYHAEFTKEEKYLENYNFLQDKIGYLCARIMMHKDHFQKCIDISNRIKQENPNYQIEYAPVFSELRPSTDPYHYDEQWHMDFFEKNSTEHFTARKVPRAPVYAYSRVEFVDNSEEPINTNAIITNKLNFFKGWTCNIHESLHIHPDGRIQMASCGVGEIVGNIQKGKFFPKRAHSIVCPKSHCHCAADLNIPKRRPGYAERL